MKGLAELEAAPLDPCTKGLPSGAGPLSIAEIGARGWSVLAGDLPLPAAVLKGSALEHNSRWMRRFVERSGAVIAPHGKTTMSPQLFHRQLEDGAWGITVATVGQLRVCREHGVSRVILANQLVGRAEICYVLEELHRDPGLELLCLVDSPEGVAILAEAARAHPIQRPLEVLLEGGFRGGRTGARDLDSALAVAEAVRDAAPHLALRGVEGFEGLIPGGTAEEVEAGVTVFLDFLVRIAVECERRGAFAAGPVVLSAGGSAFYDLVVKRFAEAGLDREMRVITRSGCYLTQDDRIYRDAFELIRERTPEVEALGEGLRPALELWAHVQSRPEPGRAILTLGKRDCGFDAGFPIPLAWYRAGEHDAPRPLPEHAVTALNDQHAFLALPPDSPLRIGDLVALGISHPCTTFDKWQLLYVVDDDYRVTSAVRTFF